MGSKCLHKKGTVTQVSNGNDAPEFYVQDELASPVLNNSISNYDDDVNSISVYDKQNKLII